MVTTGSPDHASACSPSQCCRCCGLGVVFWMLIWETVIWDMLTRASTPASRATAAIDDADPVVAKQAHQLLVKFAGKDLGPRAATDAERERAMAAWREWYAERERKQKERKGAGP